MGSALNQETRPVRVALLDDHDIARRGMESILRTAPDVQLVGDARTAAEMLQLCQDEQVDVALVDLRLPESDGIQVTHALKALKTTIAVLIVTALDGQTYREEALRAGAAGYLLKDTPMAELLHAVRQAAAGDPVVQKTAMAAVLPALDEPMPRITPQERAVLRLLARGQSNAQMAQALALSPSTVENYVVRLLDKLGAPNRAAAVTRAIAFGVFEAVEPTGSSSP